MASPPKGWMRPQRCLAICRNKAAQVGVTPTLYQHLVQDVDLPTRYRTVFIPTARSRFRPSMTKTKMAELGQILPFAYSRQLWQKLGPAANRYPSATLA